MPGAPKRGAAGAPFRILRATRSLSQPQAACLKWPIHLALAIAHRQGLYFPRHARIRVRSTSKFPFTTLILVGISPGG